MALTDGPNLGLVINGDPIDQHYTELMRQWRGLDGLIQARVISTNVTEAPGSIDNGQCFIVGVGATGILSGHANHIARYYDVGLGGPGYEFYIPKHGWSVADLSQLNADGIPKILYFNDITWVEDPITVNDISNATTIAKSMLVAEDDEAIRTIIGAGTSNLALGTTSETAKAGDYQPEVDDISDATAIAKSLLLAEDQEAMRAIIGAGTSDDGGTVTSVAVSVPTGFEVTGTPITVAGTIAISMASGYAVPTTTKQTEWDTAADLADSAIQPGDVGVSVAPLVDNLIPAIYLPSYVDDVINVANYAALPVTGEGGKIYVVETSGTHESEPFPANQQFRWAGSVYVKLVASPGTTDNVVEGSNNLYHTATRVRATALTGFVAGVGLNAVVATDTILQAFQKLQGWFNGLGNVSTLNANTIGQNIVQAANPGATRFGRANADNTWSWLTGTDFRTAIGAGTGNGSVTSVGMSTPTGLEVTGSPITASGTLAVTFQSGYSIPTNTSQTNWNLAFSQTRQWDGGATGLVPATGRASLELVKITSNIDGTVDRVLTTGAGGWLSATPATTPSNDLNAITLTGVYSADSGVANRPGGGGNWMILHMARTVDNCVQIAIGRVIKGIMVRDLQAGVWSAWYEFWSTEGLAKTTSPTDTTSGRLWRNNDLVKVTSTIDTTTGSVITVGWMGLGRGSMVVTDFNSPTLGNVFLAGATSTTTNRPSGVGWHVGLQLSRTTDNNETAQIVVGTSSDTGMHFRAKYSVDGTYFPWRTVWDSVNLVKVASTSDITAGRVPTVGWMGLGGDGIIANDWDAISQTGFYYNNTTVGAVGLPVSAAPLGLYHERIGGTSAIQMAFRTSASDQMWVRRRTASAWQPWVEIWSSANLVKTTSATDTTTGRMLKTGDGGLLGLTPALPSDDFSLTDNTTKTAMYRMGGSTANRPSGLTGGGNVLRMVRDALGGEANILVAEASNRMFWQTRVTGSWSSWGEAFNIAGASANVQTMLAAANNAAIRSAIGGVTGANIMALASPGAVRWMRINSDGSITLQTDAQLIDQILYQAVGSHISTFLQSVSTIAARAALELVKTTSSTDVTAGSMLKVGDFGVGETVSLDSPNLNSLTATGFYYASSPTNSPGVGNGWVVNYGLEANYRSQIYIAVSTGIHYRRTLIGGVWSAWVIFYDTGNTSANVQTMMGSANNAAILSNIGVGTISVPATADTVVRRDASGYVYATYYGSDIEQTTGTITELYVGINSEKWIYKVSPTYAFDQLNVVRKTGGVTEDGTLVVWSGAGSTIRGLGTIVAIRNFLNAFNVANARETIGAAAVDITQTILSSNITLSAALNGGHLYKSNTSTYDVAIPTNATLALPIGFNVTIINDGSSGNITVTPAGGVTQRMAGSATAGSRTIAAYGQATLLKVGTNTWRIIGQGVS